MESTASRRHIVKSSYVGDQQARQLQGSRHGSLSGPVYSADERDEHCPLASRQERAKFKRGRLTLLSRAH